MLVVSSWGHKSRNPQHTDNEIWDLGLEGEDDGVDSDAFDPDFA
jgi:hypothetical protein